MTSGVAASVPMAATSTIAIPLGVPNIIVRPSGENALSWKYGVELPAWSLSRTTRWPVSGSTQERGRSCGTGACLTASTLVALATRATASHGFMGRSLSG